MKRTTTDDPFLSWCIVGRNCAATVEDTLRTIRERTPEAEIVYLDTMSRDESPEIAKRYADVFQEWSGPRGDWDRDTPWVDDMAAARQHCFELARGRWRSWIDADDRLPGPEETKRLLELNKRVAPQGRGDMVVAGEERPKSVIELLAELEELYPVADCVWAPYLYHKNAEGEGLVWQDRERIVKWSDRWRWSEKAHEILVPVKGPPPPRVYFDHLLFVHEKKFTAADGLYSVSRHFDILLKQYEAGERTSRRCEYLAAYAKMTAPTRELEFIQAAHDCAGHGLDRYRALLRKGDYFSERDLYLDALEAYGSAAQLIDDLPDAWHRMMTLTARFRDYARAVEAGERVLKCEVGRIETLLSPRAQTLNVPSELAEVYRELAEMQVKAGAHEAAEANLRRATELAVQVHRDPGIGSDGLEGLFRACALSNLHRGQQVARQLADVARYLIANDEPVKALKLLESVPWNLQDHPLVIGIENVTRPIKRHVTEPDAYRSFYRSDAETGCAFSPGTVLDPNYQPTDSEPFCDSLVRARWAAEWVNAHYPDGATVLDVGCFDGGVGIPFLELALKVKYIGVDVYEKTVAKFQERLLERGLESRAELHVVDAISDLARAIPKVDVVLWFEVIEHVVRPELDLHTLACLLKHGGKLLISTPWGSFDAGHPPEKTVYGTPRDSRGHLRAMTVRDLHGVVRAAGHDLLDAWRVKNRLEITGREALHAVVGARPATDKGRPTAFVVPGALWDWNSRTVHEGGMGASEETIVYLAKALARGDKDVEVYGPVPDPEVHERVAYWPREQLRHLREGWSGKLVVSRAPAYVKTLDEWVGPDVPKILWLQDAWYPDLTPEVAARYERIVCVSEWHKQAMHNRHGAPLEKIDVLYNFIRQAEYHIPDPPERKRDHFIYASSPDRGLIRLLEVWPKIRERRPEATLDIFYGWRGAARLQTGSPDWTQRYETHRRRFEELRWQPGVTYRGMVNHPTLVREYLRAGVWLYPTTFEETGCNAAVRARAAGCAIVAPRLAALNETADVSGAGVAQWWLSDVNDDDEVVRAAVDATGIPDECRRRISEEALEKYDIARFLPRWKEILE